MIMTGCPTRGAWQRPLARDMGQCRDTRLLEVCLPRSLMEESPSVLGRVCSAAVSFAPILGLIGSYGYL